MDRWIRGDQASVDSLEWDGFKQTIAGIVAALPSSMESRGETQRQENDSNIPR